jgi:uncharacterized integral membrane protein (TIGR00698 family)
VNEQVRQAGTLLSGVAMASVAAMAAQSVAKHHGIPVMLMALLLGMSLNFLSQNSRCSPGIDFTARHVLRWGVALLGLKITATEALAIGWPPVVAVVLSVAATIAFGLVLARLMGFKPFFGLLSGGAVGICGASAAMAITAMFPHHPLRDRATLFTVVSVSTLSTMAMIVYPVLVPALGLDARQAGIFLGGTIHDVAQVVGAGYSMGETTGDAATLVKLMRVAMLVPVLLLAAWMTRHQHADAQERTSQVPGVKARRPPLLPGFVKMFVGLALLNSLIALPPLTLEAGHGLSRTFLVTAMAAIGMKTQLRDIMSVGWKPVLLVFTETLFLAGLFLVLMRFLVT